MEVEHQSAEASLNQNSIRMKSEQLDSVGQIHTASTAMMLKPTAATYLKKNEPFPGGKCEPEIL